MEFLRPTYKLKFLLNSSRRMVSESREGFPIISFSEIILVISNLTYRLLNSYNRHILTKARYVRHTKWNSMELFLFPVITFYRFFLLELARIQCTINSNSMGDVSFVKEIQFGDYQYVFMSVAFIMIFTT